jgi:outer membrane protein assembly factor BamB
MEGNVLQRRLASGEGRIYVGIHPSSVVCIDVESGDILWEYTLEEDIDGLTFSKDRLIVETKIRRDRLLNCRLICLDGETGEELWVIGDSGSNITLKEMYDDVLIFLYINLSERNWKVHYL